MAKVTSKGQVTIPVSIRRRLDIKEGDKLLFIDSPDGVVMVNPDMLPAGQDADAQLEGGGAPDKTGRAAGASSRQKKTALTVAGENRESGASEAPAAAPSTAPSTLGKQINGLDIDALLNDIRSIGSNIKKT